MTEYNLTEITKKISSDNTNYNLLELGHASCDSIEEQLRICIEKHKQIFDEEEFCICFLYVKDSMQNNYKHRIFYGFPFLPKPRPDQTVFLYNKSLDRITKRLWCLPTDARMSQLATTSVVDKKYETMQAWSIAFFEGIRLKDPSIFWDYVRHDQNITMLSESEYISAHREELIKAGCKPVDSSFSEPFDFSKIQAKKVVDPVNSILT